MLQRTRGAQLQLDRADAWLALGLGFGVGLGFGLGLGPGLGLGSGLGLGLGLGFGLRFGLGLGLEPHAGAGCDEGVPSVDVRPVRPVRARAAEVAHARTPRPQPAEAPQQRVTPAFGLTAR